jgi:hypothetical protein
MKKRAIRGERPKTAKPRQGGIGAKVGIRSFVGERPNTPKPGPGTKPRSR